MYFSLVNYIFVRLYLFVKYNKCKNKKSFGNFHKNIAVKVVMALPKIK